MVTWIKYSYFKWRCIFSNIILPLIILPIVAIASIAFQGCSRVQNNGMNSINLGVLVSLTGPSASEEKSVADAILLAVEEINQNGGLLGKKINPIVVDGASSESTFIKETQNLIEKSKVSAIIGGSTSSIRRSINSIIKTKNSMLLYPFSYEGSEKSSHTVFVGAAPNQQIIPATVFAYKHLGKRFYLVGTDSIYSHMANEMIKDIVYALNGELVGEDYILLSSNSGIESIIAKINLVHPSVIINTLESDSCVKFVQALRASSIFPDNIPTVYLKTSEVTLRQLKSIPMEGDYSVASYFQSIDLPENKKFLHAIQNKYGKGRAVNDNMVAAYSAVYLWAQAVQEAETEKPEDVLEYMKSQSFISPGGLIQMDPDNLSIYKMVRIGKIVSNDQFSTIWSSNIPVIPMHYPFFRAPQQWDDFAQDLYVKWGRQWFSSKE